MGVHWRSNFPRRGIGCLSFDHPSVRLSVHFSIRAFKQPTFANQSTFLVLSHQYINCQEISSFDYSCEFIQLTRDPKFLAVKPEMLLNGISGYGKIQGQKNLKKRNRDFLDKKLFIFKNVPVFSRLCCFSLYSSPQSRIKL